MGPPLLLRDAADGIEWAHLHSQDMLPMALNGPTFATETCCQWHWMGPPYLPRLVVNSVEWAYCCYRDMLPMALNGPSGVPQ